jgi:hypothetical protein
MLCVLDLPAEILAQIVRHVNINGDFSRLRLSNSRFLEIGFHRHRLLFEDLCLRYDIGRRSSRLYLSLAGAKRTVNGGLEPSTRDVLKFTNFLHETKALAAGVDHAMSRRQLSSREPFVLFAIFSEVLNSSLTISHSTMSDLLAPAVDAVYSFSKSFSQNFVQFLREELTLEELEAVIAGISVCVTKLWSDVFMFRPKDYTISGFGSLSGASFNTDKAILTEHVIWRGPLWAARILKLYGSARNPLSNTDIGTQLDDTLVRDGIWKGSREEGARLVANGVARLLWRERQLKIDAREKLSAGPARITDMRVDVSVWRGSSGDM